MVGRVMSSGALTIDAVARLRRRWIEAEATRQQVIGQEAEQLLVVRHASELEVGEGFVRHRHPGSRQRRQLRVQRVGTGQADQPLVRLTHVLRDALQAVREAGAAAHQADDNHLGRRQDVVQERVDICVVLQVIEAGGAHARKVSWKSGGGLIEDEQIGVGVCQEQKSVGRYREGGWRAGWSSIAQPSGRSSQRNAVKCSSASAGGGGRYASAASIAST